VQCRCKGWGVQSRHGGGFVSAQSRVELDQHKRNLGSGRSGRRSQPTGKLLHLNTTVCSVMVQKKWRIQRLSPSVDHRLTPAHNPHDYNLCRLQVVYNSFLIDPTTAKVQPLTAPLQPPYLQSSSLKSYINSTVAPFSTMFVATSSGAADMLVLAHRTSLSTTGATLLTSQHPVPHQLPITSQENLLLSSDNAE
jgi:hypothetical protein